jgi:hypothetical protein
MASRVFLHIGTMKSATTYLQELAYHNSDRLAAGGMFWPPGDLVFPAVAELLGRDAERPARTGAWARLVHAVAEHPGLAVISNELLAPVGRRVVQQLVEAFSPAQIDVVVTARDLGRVIPSHWQTTLKNGSHMPWTEFAAAVCAEPAERRGVARSVDVGSWFWRRHDVPGILSRWARHLAPERQWVVTVPGGAGGATDVWDRFAEVLGISSQGFTAPVHDNSSVGAWSAELLRRLNVASPQFERPHFRWGVKESLVRRGLATRAGTEPRFGLSVEQFQWVEKRAERMIEEIRSAGVRVVGDLEDLRPTAPPADLVDPVSATDADLLSAALTGIAGLVDVVAELAVEKERISMYLDVKIP